MLEIGRHGKYVRKHSKKNITLNRALPKKSDCWVLWFKDLQRQKAV